jgi:putative peptidoglycan lipid II flippase
MGIKGFAWGVLGGAFIGNFLVQLIGLRNLNPQFRFRINLGDPDLHRYVLLTLPFIVGVGMQFSNEVFFRFFGSFLSTGGIASLNYSLRTMWVLVGFGQAIATASFPFLSSLAAENKLKELNTVSHDVLGKMLLLLLPVTAMMMVLAPEILTVLFQRRHFTAASTALTAPVLTLYLIGVFGFAANTLLTRMFYALQKTVLPMIVSTLVAVVSIPIYWVLSKMLGAPGVALAGAISATALMIILYWFWTTRHGDAATVKKIMVLFLKVLIASVIGAGACFAAKHGLWMIDITQAVGAFISNCAVGLIAGAIGLAVSFGLMSLLGVTEVWGMLKKLVRKAS